MKNNNYTANKRHQGPNNNKNNQDKNWEYQKHQKFERHKEKILRKGDLIKIRSPYRNDYHTKDLDSIYLGLTKVRPAFISEETLSPHNEKYFTVTLATHSQGKGQVDFFTHKNGIKYTLNPTETFIYKEEELFKVQNEFIGEADLRYKDGYNFLMKRINESIPERQHLKEVKSLVEKGNTKKADDLIKSRIPQPTKTDIHNQKIHRFAALNYKTAAEKEEYIKSNIIEGPSSDDEPSE